MQLHTMADIYLHFLPHTRWVVSTRYKPLGTEGEDISGTQSPRRVQSENWNTGDLQRLLLEEKEHAAPEQLFSRSDGLDGRGNRSDGGGSAISATNEGRVGKRGWFGFATRRLNIGSRSGHSRSNSSGSSIGTLVEDDGAVYLGRY
jgi:hypothetical protein